MIDFITDHWQLFCSLILAIINLIVTLCVHSRSSKKISGLNTETTQNTASVAEALLTVVTLSKEVLDEIQSTKTQGQASLCQNCESNSQD